MLIGSTAFSRALVLFSLITILASYSAVKYNEEHLSPQGCKMSWMSPSYVLQSDFNVSWTPLAKRYSLRLYREVGWETGSELHGSPVLFIPGNAGSSEQVRSIASSTIRQVYDSPLLASADFATHKIAPVDMFTAEFNEDLSALHGPTLLSQMAYIESAVGYILSLYGHLHNPPKQVLLLGHSMGGVVAISLLPDERISAVITMSSPTSLPPARFDRRMESLYSDVLEALYPMNSSTGSAPVLSLCGGATDTMIPSETCHLPQAPSHWAGDLYRKTVFTTGLEGVWTSVGHNEIVWCHQVRWRVARVAIEMALARSIDEREEILDRWFLSDLSPHYKSQPVTHATPISDLASTWSISTSSNGTMRVDILPSQSGAQTGLTNSGLYLLPITPHKREHLVLLASRVLIQDDISSFPIGFEGSEVVAKLYICSGSSAESSACSPISLYGPRTSITAIPILSPGKPFPPPKEGSNPSDVGVLFETEVAPSTDSSIQSYVAVLVSGPLMGHRQGVIITLEPLEKSLDISNGVISRSGLVTKGLLPKFTWNALFVYRMKLNTPIVCPPDPFIPALLHYQSSYAEAHFHSLEPDALIRIHSHSVGPFVAAASGREGEPNLRIIRSDHNCAPSSFSLSVDVWSTIGRLALRYWSSVVVWGVGVIGLCMASAWAAWESGSPFPAFQHIYADFVTRRLLSISCWMALLSLLPLPKEMLMGTAGEMLLAPFGFLFVLLATGFLGFVIFLLEITFSVIRRLSYKRSIKAPDSSVYTLRNVAAWGVILLFVLIFMPHQVAFLITWLISIRECALVRHVVSTSTTASDTTIRLVVPEGVVSKRSDDVSELPDEDPPGPRLLIDDGDSQNIYKAVVVLQTFLVPLQAPVLAVWIRTIATAGVSAPFSGDHNALAVCFWLFVADRLVNGLVWRRSTHRSLALIVPGMLLLLSSYAFLFGLRYTYGIYNLATAFTAVVSSTFLL